MVVGGTGQRLLILMVTRRRWRLEELMVTRDVSNGRGAVSVRLTVHSCRARASRRASEPLLVRPPKRRQLLAQAAAVAHQQASDWIGISLQQATTSDPP